MYNDIIDNQFALPVVYDLIAVFLFAITGSLIALKRGYDPIGVAIMTIVSGAGGGIIRDAIFLNRRPSAVTNWHYSAVLLFSIAVVLLARSVLKTRPISFLIIIVEALGIGLNSVYGTQESIAVGLSVFSAIIVGFMNAVGGRLLRDIVMGRERKNLVPGRMFGLAAICSVCFYILLSQYFGLNSDVCAWSAITLAFVVRIVAVKYNLQSKALIDYYDPSERIVSRVSNVISPRVEKIANHVKIRDYKKKK